VFEKNAVAGGALRYAGLAPKFQNVDASAHSLLRYVDALVGECRDAGVQFEFGWNLQQRAAELAGFDHIVVCTGARYRGGMGIVITGLLRAGLFRAPLLRAIARHPGVRKWFYEKARRPTGPSITRRLPESVPVTVIGDARVAGKSDAAIRDAVFSACGVTPSSVK
jgi:hypothetical protein